MNDYSLHVTISKRSSQKQSTKMNSLRSDRISDDVFNGASLHFRTQSVNDTQAYIHELRTRIGGRKVVVTIVVGSHNDPEFHSYMTAAIDSRDSPQQELFFTILTKNYVLTRDCFRYVVGALLDSFCLLNYDNSSGRLRFAPRNAPPDFQCPILFPVEYVGDEEGYIEDYVEDSFADDAHPR